MRVYVGNAESLDIRVFDLDEHSGALTLLQTAFPPDVDIPSPVSMPLALSHDRRFLHAAVRCEPFTLFTFSRDATDGRLAYVSSAALPLNPVYLRVDHAGHFLLCASYKSRGVCVLPVATDGTIGRAQQVIEETGSVHCIMPDH